MKLDKVVNNIESTIVGFLSNSGIKDPKAGLERPSDFKYGDVTTSAALRYAKELEKNPLELAEDLRAHLLASEINYLEKAEVSKPGFVNISLTQEFYLQMLSEILKSSGTFGKNNYLKGEKWVVEHTSPNPNKAMHLGHLRNNLVGMSLVRLLEWHGAEVVSDAVDNNRGIAIAKVMWGFLSRMKKGDEAPTDAEYWATHKEGWFSPEEKDLLPDIFITRCYVLGEEEFKSDKKVEENVRELVVKWEEGDKSVRELSSHLLFYAYAGMERTLKRLGSHWDKIWHEDEHYQEGKKYVEKGLKKRIFKKLEDGAILTDLAKYDLPDTILLKNDGTSLYITQDIALTALKKKHYKADKLIWVVGPDQALAMKQVFAICDQLGIGSLDDFTHISYGYVGLKDEDGSFKKMSSREGTVVLIDDVIDFVKRKIEERGAVTEDQSEKMALAAVKFSILKSDRVQDLAFDPLQSISISGDSGIYVLYTYVRTQSILQKKGGEVKASSTKGEMGLESDVVKLLMYFPEAIRRSMEDLSVHHVAQYLLELSAAFNSWYGKEVILDDSDREAYKLSVTKATGTVIKNGLSILGIETVERI